MELKDIPAAGTEIETLLGALERQRATFAWKCGGLDAAGLRARLGPSTVTLGGLLKHMALVEEVMFQYKLYGRRPGPPWDPAHADDDDWEWRSAAEDSPAELEALWREAAERSRRAVAAALEDGGLDRLGEYRAEDGSSPSLRRLLVDMSEEYARHTGHADLIRESVDGLVGEDPPR